MKSSCINHPPRESLIIIRQWQIDACEGDRCAAALLSFFEYWHNIKEAQKAKAAQANDVAERHGDGRTQDESLYQWHNGKELEAGLLGLYASKSISAGIQKLVELGFVTVHKNPNPRYHFDSTRHFLFHPEAINRWIGLRYIEKGEPIAPKGMTVERNGSTAAPFSQSSICTETTSETSSETTPLTPLKAEGGGVEQRECLCGVPEFEEDVEAVRPEGTFTIQPEFQELKVKISDWFERSCEGWDYEELRLLAKVAKRPGVLAEFEQIKQIKTFPPESTMSALRGWGSLVDRSKKQKRTGQSPEIPEKWEVRTITPEAFKPKTHERPNTRV